MKIERFNKINEQVESEISYEIWYYDKHGDAQEYSGEEYMNVDPFDLEDIVKFFEELEEIGENVFIKKIVATRLSDRMVNKLKMEFDAKKYNI